MSRFVRKRESAPSGMRVVADPQICSYGEMYPAIWEYLTEASWEDGSDRETATFLMLWEEGMFKACIHDRAEQRSAWWSAPTLTALWDRVEADLASDLADWRRKVPPPRTGGRKTS